MINNDHRQVQALFPLYLGTPSDSRQASVGKILDRLTLHLKMEEELLFGKIRNSGPEGMKLVEAAEMEHEEVKTMIHELQRSETDDDQALDEFFEDMMQTVRAHFITEERNLLPLAERTLDTSPL